MLTEIITCSLSKLNQKGFSLSESSSRVYDLVQRIAARKKTVLYDLFTVNGRCHYYYAVHLSGLPSEAEDSVRETLLRVWQTAGYFRGEGHMVT